MKHSRLKKIANLVPAEFISLSGTARIGEIITDHGTLVRAFGGEHQLDLTPGDELIQWNLKYCNGFNVESCEPVSIYRSYRDLPPGSDATELLSDNKFTWSVGGYYDSPNKDLILNELQNMLG